jgi:hypothetical protein
LQKETKMNFKLFMMTAVLGLGLTSMTSSWGAFCDPVGNPSFIMNAAAGSTGTITCAATSSGNIHYVGNDVRQDPGAITLFTNVTDLSSSVTGLFNNAPKVDGFGSFNITATVWDSWASIYVALKQGNGYGLFLITKDVTSGTWKTTPGSGTGLSHYLAFGGEELPPPSQVPVPAAVWLFGSAMAGLFGTSRRKSMVAVQA